MGVHVVVVYLPKDGRQSELEAETAAHVPLLRRLGYATDTMARALRAPDGSIVESFEWSSREAIESAHEHPEVLAMWGRYERCCSYGTLADLPNAETLFAEFEFLGAY